MSPDLAATRLAVEALCVPGASYGVSPDGLSVTGSLTVVDAQLGGAADGGAADGGAGGSVWRAFTVTVHLDPATGRYTLSEQSTGADAYGAPVPNALVGRSWSRSTTRGHVVKRTLGTVRTPVVFGDGAGAARLDYDAANSRLVGPLEAALAGQGWSRRRGPLARLLGL